MYAVQSRINGYLVDEERCATLGAAREALDRRRRALATAGAAIVAEDPWRHVLARTPNGWITVMIADGEQH